MNNYLIFRTDRIGDFLVSAILIKSIKINDPLSRITLIASNKNFSYIKKFQSVDEVIKLDNNFLSKVKLILKLRKGYFKNVIIHDDKKRSKFISQFLKYKTKIIIENQNKFSHIEVIKNILKRINFTFHNDSLNILKDKITSNPNQIVQIHFDEKWIYKDYIKSFINIEPTSDKLIKFLLDLQNKTKKKLIVTSGHKIPDILRKISSQINKTNIKIYDNLDFSELEGITSKSEILISCHGAISHVAAAFNIKQIDIIDKSYNYNRWTEHFRNYNYLYREKFDILANKILEKL